MKLANKIAIVTGAASGIGKAIAIIYAKEGAAVMLADYNMVAAEEVAATIVAAGGTAKAIKVDVANADDIANMIDTTISEFGGLDILVNNAGIMDGFEPVGEISDERWDRVFDINTKGIMRAMRKAINYWLDNERQGVIINTISTGGMNGAHAGVAYVASKHAVVALTKNTGFMYAQKGIRVNGIAPGAVATNIADTITDVSEFGLSRAKMTQIWPRVGKPEEIATTALFLACDDSSFINGTVITADSGWTAAF